MNRLIHVHLNASSTDVYKLAQKSKPLHTIKKSY